MKEVFRICRIFDSFWIVLLYMFFGVFVESFRVKFFYLYGVVGILVMFNYRVRILCMLGIWCIGNNLLLKLEND